ncbi:hypothetical protein V8G54_012441 [Vigna mungo]|uniref:Uncharacterized protein n=1 Tax=Vigna mungo TaxID=3915 RepID=A0AAQ3NT43_VIGMU
MEPCDSWPVEEALLRLEDVNANHVSSCRVTLRRRQTSFLSKTSLDEDAAMPKLDEERRPWLGGIPGVWWRSHGDCWHRPRVPAEGLGRAKSGRRRGAPSGVTPRGSRNWIFQQFSTLVIQILILVLLLPLVLRAFTLQMDKLTSKYHREDTLMVVSSSISLVINLHNLIFCNALIIYFLPSRHDPKWKFSGCYGLAILNAYLDSLGLPNFRKGCNFAAVAATILSTTSSSLCPFSFWGFDSHPSSVAGASGHDDGPFNIIPLHNLLTDHPSLRFPEVRAAVAALRAVGDLRRPPFGQWQQNMGLLNWLALVFGFQRDNVRNQREHLVLNLVNAQMRLTSSSDNIDTLDASVLWRFRKKLLKDYGAWCPRFLSLLDVGMQYRLVSRETIGLGVRMMLKCVVAVAWIVVFDVFYAWIVVFGVFYARIWTRRNQDRQWSPVANDRVEFCGGNKLEDFREEGIISNKEFELLEMPENSWNVRVIRWPCFLLCNELLFDTPSGQRAVGDNDKRLYKKIWKSEYRRGDVIEAYDVVLSFRHHCMSKMKKNAT